MRTIKLKRQRRRVRHRQFGGAEVPVQPESDDDDRHRIQLHSLHQDPRELASVNLHVIGPLQRDRNLRACARVSALLHLGTFAFGKPPHSRGHRNPGEQRQQPHTLAWVMRTWSWAKPRELHRDRHDQLTRFRRTPRAVQPAPTLGLFFGHQHREVLDSPTVRAPGVQRRPHAFRQHRVGGSDSFHNLNATKSRGLEGGVQRGGVQKRTVN